MNDVIRGPFVEYQRKIPKTSQYVMLKTQHSAVHFSIGLDFGF